MTTTCARRQHGFTLIEALVVIAMIGVLLALAAPSFNTFTANQRVKTASFDVYAALVFARSEAIKRRQSVTVAIAQDPATSEWGWTVSTGGTPLRTQDTLKGVVLSGATSVVYRLDGRLTAASAVGVLIEPQTANASISNRCIRVDLTGLPKSTTISSTTCP